jgi:anti-anti-sigma factor
VVLDLDGVTYINSAGLGAIFVLRKFAMEAGAKLVLARPTAAIRRLLDTANIPTLIPVTDDLDEARRVLAGDNEVKEVRN